MLASEASQVAAGYRGDFRHGRGAAELGGPADLPAPTFYPAGAEIYAQGDPCGKLYRVSFGCVRTYRLLADGRRQIAAFYLAGQTFGFESDKVHHFFAEAICDSGIQTLHTGLKPEEQATELLPVALECLLRTEDHLLMLGRQNALERIAAFLLEMHEQQGGRTQVELPMSRSDIADYLGLTVETVSRMFSHLKRKGVIRLPTLRSVELIHQNALQGIVCH